MRVRKGSQRSEGKNLHFKNLRETRVINNNSRHTLCSVVYACRLLCAQVQRHRPSKRDASKHLVSPRNFLRLGLFQEKSFAVTGSVCTATSLVLFLFNYVVAPLYKISS